MTRARISLLAALVALFVAAGIGTAWAYWSASGSGNAAASGDTFPTTAGAKPTASVAGGTATVGFTAVTTNGGHAAAGYTVLRYDSTGATLKSSTTGSCSTVGTAVTCTTGSVPDGTWTFGYQPLLGNWQGAVSNLSDPATADATAPTISVAAIGPSSGSGVGSIHQGGTYYVYANATDATSGLASVTANVSAVTTGSTSVALTTTSGPFTAGGTTYSYRSAQLTANSTLSAGSKSFTVTATDNASNSTTANGSVTVDNTPPATPTALDMTAATDSGSSSTDNITNVAKPTFTGTADPNTTVKIYDGVAEVGSGTSTGTGSFSITLGTALTDGSHTITAKAIDAADNASLASGSVSVTVDTTAPAPSGIAATDDGNPGQIASKNSSHFDTLTLTYADANGIDAASIVTGWNGSGNKTVSVTFTDGGAANDSMTIPGLGTVDLGGTGWLTGGSTSANETLIMTNSKTLQLQITATPSNSGTGNLASTFTWSATGSTAKDIAGNAAAGSVAISNQRF